jgi:hypothetical protein
VISINLDLNRAAQASSFDSHDYEFLRVINVEREDGLVMGGGESVDVQVANPLCTVIYQKCTINCRTRVYFPPRDPVIELFASKALHKYKNNITW